jgi:hypothetical protein
MTTPGEGFAGSPESHDAAAKAFDAVPDADKAGVVMTAVNTMPDAGKVDVATAAVKAVPDAEKAGVATAAVNAVPDAEKAGVAAAAVNAVPDASKVDAISSAINSAPEGVGRQVLDRLMPAQKVTNQIWLWIVITFAIVLVGTTLALIGAVYVSFWRKVDTALVQILLTVLTTVAGILAGFISGRASQGRT